MKRILPLLLLLSACATTQQRRCDALQDELSDANEPCGACLKRLAPYGDAGLCQYLCAHGGTVSPVAVSACSAVGQVPSSAEAGPSGPAEAPAAATE